MGDKTKIEWTDTTWNPIRGCSRKSAGCQGCYAEEIAARFSGPGMAFEGLAHRVDGKARWTGKVKLFDDKLTEPLRWKKPRRIFVNSVSDLFHENLPDEAIDKVFAVMALAPQHTFQVLTKRADRMREYLTADDGRAAPQRQIEYLRGRLREHQDGHRDACDFDALDHVINLNGWPIYGDEHAWPLRNVWLGVSVEDQAAADERIPDLLATPAAVRFLSCEPLIGPVDLSPWLFGPEKDCADCPRDMDCECGWKTRKELGLPHIHQVIGGGESGPKARPMHPDWPRQLRDQCAAADVAYFHKQNGAWAPCQANDGEWPIDRGSFIRLTADGRREADGWPMQRVGKEFAGRLLDGVEHNGLPEVER